MPTVKFVGPFGDIVVLAPIFFDADNREEVLKQLTKAGFYRAWIGGTVHDLNETDTTGVTSLELVINRLRVEDARRAAITEAIEQAFELSKGSVNVLEEGERNEHRCRASCFD